MANVLLPGGGPIKAIASNYYPPERFRSVFNYQIRFRQFVQIRGRIRLAYADGFPRLRWVNMAGDPAYNSPEGAASGLQPWGYCSGDGQIAGTVTVNSAPVSRPVYLFHAGTMRLVQSTQSAAADGAYSFLRILRGVEYVVLARDDAGRLYNVAGADFVTPVPM